MTVGREPTAPSLLYNKFGDFRSTIGFPQRFCLQKICGKRSNRLKGLALLKRADNMSCCDEEDR